MGERVDQAVGGFSGKVGTGFPVRKSGTKNSIIADGKAGAVIEAGARKTRLDACPGPEPGS